MTIRFSTGMQNALAQGRGFCGALNHGHMRVFSGSQPATPDLVETGTLLGIITKSSLALTKETRASATLTITGTSGTLTSLVVGTCPIIGDPGALVTTSANTTTIAGLVADLINRNGYAEATSSGAVVTVKPRPGCGTAWNTLALTMAGVTTSGAGTFASGVASVNTLILGQPLAGVIEKSTDVWSMNGLSPGGTAGWFRFYGSDDPYGATSTVLYPRMDGSCGVGSGDAQLSSLAVTLNSPHTVDVFKFTVPAA